MPLKSIALVVLYLPHYSLVNVYQSDSYVKDSVIHAIYTQLDSYLGCVQASQLPIFHAPQTRPVHP